MATSNRKEMNMASLEHMFDLDNHEDEFNLPEPAAQLDTERIAREAREKARATLKVGQTPATNSAATGDDFGRKRKERDEDEEDGKSKRKPLAKIDAERLLGPHGFPALLKQTQNFKLKGKSHEKEDLDRVMTIYQLWAHRMFPKRKFIDTVDRVEKVCREKRMMVALSVWRDNALNPDKGQSQGDDQAGSDYDKPEDDDAATPRPAAGRATNAPQSSRPAASTRTADEDEEDEAIWEEILGRMKTNAPAISGQETGSSAAPAASDRRREEDADEDGLWDEIMQDSAAASSTKAVSKANSAPVAKPGEGEEDDDALWDELMRDDAAAQASTAAPTVKSSAAAAPARHDDEDEDALWDEIMRNESAASASKPVTSDGDNVSSRKTMPVEDEDMDLWDLVREMEEQQEKDAVTAPTGQIPAPVTDGTHVEPAQEQVSYESRTEPESVPAPVIDDDDLYA